MHKKLLSLLLALTLTLALVPFQSFAADGWTDVADINQFRAALESPYVTQIRLTNHIFMDKKSIVISPYKASLTIDGNGYAVTQSESNVSSNTICLNAMKCLTDITVRNIGIYGRNNSGFIYVPDSCAYAPVTLRYEKFKYNGPQLVDAKYSNAVLKDCEIIYWPGYANSNGEIVAAQNIRLEGYVSIIKQMPGDTHDVFKLTKYGRLTVASGAWVYITNNTQNCKSTTSGFVGVALSKNCLVFEDGCSFNYEGSKVFQDGYAFDNVYVGKNAVVNATIHEDLTCVDGLLNVNNYMTVNENASVRFIADGNTNCRPIIKFESKSNLIVNNPKEFFLYNASTYKCNTGLAIGNECDMNVSLNNIGRLEHWVCNRAPYTNLGPATYDFANGNKSFNCFANYYSGKAKLAYATNYAGATPYNALTCFYSDVNVIRIGGYVMGPVQ